MSGRWDARVSAHVPDLPGLPYEKEAQAAIAAAVNDLELMGCSNTKRYGVGGPGGPHGPNPAYLVPSRVRGVPAVSSCTRFRSPSRPRVSFCVLLVPRMRDTSLARRGTGTVLQVHRSPTVHFFSRADQLSLSEPEVTERGLHLLVLEPTVVAPRKKDDVCIAGLRWSSEQPSPAIVGQVVTTNRSACSCQAHLA